MNKKHCFMLIHGYQSLKADMLSIEEALNSKGFETHNVSLAGHDDERKDEFVETAWNDWFESVERQYLYYKSQGYTVSLIGHSLGGVLSLALNQKYNDKSITSLVIIASPLYLNKYSTFEILHPLLPLVSLIKPFTKKISKKYFSLAHVDKDTYYYPVQLASMIAKMHEIRNNLYKLTTPILILQAYGDKTVPESCPKEMAKLISSQYKKIVMYTMFDQYSKKHQIVTHPETKDRIIQDIFDFIEETKDIVLKDQEL